MRRVLAFGASFAVAFASFVPAALAQGDPPRVEIGSDRVAPDEQLQVRGDRWPVGELVNVELCGNDGLDATVDCDLQNSAGFAVRESRSFFGSIQIGYPPKPCPCVVRFSSPSAAAITIPIDFPSAGFAPAEQQVLDADVSRLINVTKLDVRRTNTWPTWFGAPAEHEAEIEITNSGNVAIANTTLTVNVGRGQDPTDIVASRDVDVMAPGETIQILVPFELGLLSFGRYTAKASIDGSGAEVVARAQTSTYPWGLMILALVIVQLALLRLRNRVRSRIQRRMDAPMPAEGTTVHDDMAKPQVIDLRDDAIPEPVGDHPVPLEAAAESDIETLVGAELSEVFDTARQLRHNNPSDPAFRGLVADLTAGAAERISEKTVLSTADQESLRSEMTGAILAAFDMDSEPVS